MRVSRVLGATVGALTLTFALSGLVQAAGQTGNYLWVDSMQKAGAVCKYDSGGRIYRMRIEAPQLWWPDRNDLNTTEHGKVGWRAIIEHTNAGPGWVFLKQTSIQTATAYEGYPGGYDLDDKAPFTAKVVDISAGSLPALDELRVKIKAFWYRKDGSVLGSLTHVDQWYVLKLGTSAFTQQSPCPKYVN